jgi:Probable Zinc-ribbon domain
MWFAVALARSVNRKQEAPPGVELELATSMATSIRELSPRKGRSGWPGHAFYPDHVWETRASSRTYQGAFCPYHMGNRVHPSESLAAYLHWLAKEWHPTRNIFRADQVARASAHRATLICDLGHEWSEVTYSRTLSQSDRPECYKLTAAERNRVAGSPADSNAMSGR